MERVFSKRNIIVIIVYFTALLGIKFYQFHTIQNIIEFGISLLSIPFICIFGVKALFASIIVFVSVLMHLNTNMLYLALIFYTITSFLARKYLIPLTFIYHINAITTYIFDEKTANINVIIYFSLCVIIFLLLYFYPHITRPKLDLTEDEKIILKELANNKQLKEIDGFSKNTKTEKIKSACKRNNIRNKHELVYIFKQSENWE